MGRDRKASTIMANNKKMVLSLVDSCQFYSCHGVTLRAANRTAMIQVKGFDIPAGKPVNYRPEPARGYDAVWSPDEVSVMMRDIEESRGSHSVTLETPTSADEKKKKDQIEKEDLQSDIAVLRKKKLAMMADMKSLEAEKS